jgi:hypothetical protein
MVCQGNGNYKNWRFIMELTNNFGLPGAFVEAIKNDTYVPGKDTDASVTGLLAPPRQQALMKLHGGDIVGDVSDRVFALIGQAIHSILERAEPSAMTEDRLYMDIEGWRISGQYDRLTLRGVTLQDYKIMSVWEVLHGLKPEKEQQLNMLQQLAVDNGYDKISRLEVIGVFRDWSKSKARYDKKYPQAQVKRMPVELWPEEKRVEFIRERIRLHKAARETLPECTQDERWATPDKWAVMKKGRKSAVRLLDSETEAEVFMRNKNVPGGYIVHRKGESKRCQDYCDVSVFCEQWAKLKED